MSLSFEERLAIVTGTVHVVDFSDDFERFRSGLLYYWNKAEPLHDAAKLVWPVFGLNDVAIMLTGMSIELLLKGIQVALNESVSSSHGLSELCASVGIALTEAETVIIRAISEYVTWAARYPTPNTANQMFRAQEIFQKQRRAGGSLATYYVEDRNTSFENCERLWEMIATYYHRAREARIESVEFLYKKERG